MRDYNAPPPISRNIEGYGTEFVSEDIEKSVIKKKKVKSKVKKPPKLTISEKILKNFREKDLFRLLRDGKNVKKVMEIFEARLANAKTQLDKKLMKTAIDAYRLGVERANGHLGEGLFIETPFGAPAIHTIQYYLDDYTIPALARLSDDITKAVEGVCKDFITNYGQNLTDLEKSIRKALGESGVNVRYRAHMIARTELSRLVNNGYMGHCDNVYPDAKYDWLSNPGACDHCGAISAGGPYTHAELDQITGGFVPHPNCRCRPIIHTRFLEKKEVKKAKKTISKDLKKHQARIGTAKEQERRFKQELKTYCKENKLDYGEVKKIMNTDEYKSYLKHVQNNTLHHRTTELDKILKEGKLKSQAMRREIGKRRATLKDKERNVHEYVFFHETRGSPLYGRTELVFNKAKLNEKYLMEWTREDSIIFKNWDELKNCILSTEQYDKLSAAVRIARGGPWKHRACVGEARILNSVDIKDVEKIIFDGGFVGRKKVTKELFKEYLPQAQKLVKEYPWLEGKVYIEVCDHSGWVGWELLA